MEEEGGEGRRGLKEEKGTAQIRTMRLKDMAAYGTWVGTSVVGEGHLGVSCLVQ